MTYKELKNKWLIILSKIDEDLFAKEYDECAKGLKEKIYLSRTEISELKTLICEKRDEELVR